MKISVIGGGNMGGAIVRGLTQGNIFKPEDITVVDVNEAPLKALKEYNSSINIALNNYESIKNTDIIILAVKPWLIKDVLIDIKFMLDYTKQTIISVAAGISISEIRDTLIKGYEASAEPVIFRVVPNTAISVKQSVTLVASSPNASSQQKDFIANIFNELGCAISIEENKIVAGTALTSCGIAFFFRYVKAAMSAGVEMGFSAKDAQEMTVKTMLGAATLLDETKGYPEQEIDKVTTPGGITIKGINELEANGFTNAIIKALKACK
ncbi:pyrroline-5-carboxylate reductase [Dysgonomonadaceae bacterium PH5-43]|nr:pyrroline-5-carboxylate reductase [Dysgonomonadaceae bacterium PH5-43]